MDTQSVRTQIRAAIKSIPKPIRKGKIGRQLHEDITAALRNLTEFRIVKEDEAKFLQAQMPVWRDKKNNEIEPTKTQRKIDIVVYSVDLPIALIEVESDLNDLQLSGISNRRGHYDVFSIARSAAGHYFHSYKSLERMAAAAMYYHLRESSHNYSQESAVEYLESLMSDSPTDHNPSKLPMFLVSGSCRAMDHGILAPRLKSLDAELICLP